MKINIFFLVTVVLFSCVEEQKVSDKVNTKDLEIVKKPTNKVILSSEIVWEKLNPARGDNSPRAGTIWGDRNDTLATGFLAKFVDGFSSPPHIHNVTYRAVVIKGLIHNDDANAETMWMPTGSFWTQPKGAAHITSAKGKENIAYVEIDQGPYLVKPVNEAFVNRERAVNIDATNIIWLDNTQTSWINSDSKAQISFLWEHQKIKGLKGIFVKLPGRFSGQLTSYGEHFHSVIISGNMSYKIPQNKSIEVLDAGSYFTSNGTSIHTIKNTTEEDVIFYIRTNGVIKIH